MVPRATEPDSYPAAVSDPAPAVAIVSQVTAFDLVSAPPSSADQDPTCPSAPGSIPGDVEALDAYSRVVTYVAETLAPSVANLRVSRRGRQRGGGSGVVITP